MDVQNRYWKMLVQLRFENFYLEKYLDHSRRWERGINIFLAITSAPVIAAWAIWKIWNITEVLWIGLVATSQVINAIRPFLPLSKRVKALSQMIPQLSMLSFEVERDWYFVSQGQLTCDEINKLSYHYLLEYEKLDNPLEKVHLPIKKKIKTYADKAAEKYCNKYFSMEGIERCKNIK